MKLSDEEYERIRLKLKAGKELSAEEMAAFFGSDHTKEEKKPGCFTYFIGF